MPFKYVGAILAFTFGLLLFDEKLSTFALVGMGLAASPMPAAATRMPPSSRMVLGLHMVVCLPMAASSPSSRSAPPTLVTTARSTLPGTCRLLTAARRPLPRTIEAEREAERPPLRSN